MEDFLFQDYETVEFSEDKLARFQRSALIDKEVEMRYDQNSLQALAEAKRIESWKRKREKIKQKKKDTITNIEQPNQTHEEENVSESNSIAKEYTQPNKYKWRNMKYEEIAFSLPNIVIDLSFTREQPERVFLHISHKFTS